MGCGIRVELHSHLSRMSPMCAFTCEAGPVMEPVRPTYHIGPHYPLPHVHPNLHRGEYRVEERVCKGRELSW